MHAPGEQPCFLGLAAMHAHAAAQLVPVARRELLQIVVESSLANFASKARIRSRRESLHKPAPH